MAKQSVSIDEKIKRQKEVVSHQKISTKPR